MERMRNAQVSVGVANVEIAPELEVESQRKVLVISNISPAAQVISISWESEAVAGVGVVLYPGGQWAESLDSRFVPSNSRINAISDIAGGVVAIHERILG